MHAPCQISCPSASLPAGDARLATNASYCARGTTCTVASIAVCWIPQSS